MKGKEKEKERESEREREREESRGQKTSRVKLFLITFNIQTIASTNTEREWRKSDRERDRQ